MNKRSVRRRTNYSSVIGYLLLCCVIVVVLIGLLSKNHSEKSFETMECILDSETEQTSIKETDTVLNIMSEDTLTEKISTTPIENTSTEDITEENFSEAGYTVNYEHIYVREGKDKQILLTTSVDRNREEFSYSTSDESIATVDSTGLVMGVSQGACTLYIDYDDERLEIAITVRKLTVEDGCTYVDGILVANKSYALPESYNPGLLDEVKEAFEQLVSDAASVGLTIYDASDYRSYSYQTTVYNSMINTYGQEYADTVSARPGHSEHQTGLTIDCNTIENGFADTAEGKWLAEHCAEYGFIIRYPDGKEEITGYAYESWHIRYVGIEHATAITEQGLCLEEYLDITSVYED